MRTGRLVMLMLGLAFCTLFLPARGRAQCSSPSNVSGSQRCTQNAFRVAWSGGSGATSYRLEYRPPSTTEWTSLGETAATERLFVWGEPGSAFLQPLKRESVEFRVTALGADCDPFNHVSLPTPIVVTPMPVAVTYVFPTPVAGVPGGVRVGFYPFSPDNDSLLVYRDNETSPIARSLATAFPTFIETLCGPHVYKVRTRTGACYSDLVAAVDVLDVSTAAPPLLALPADNGSVCAPVSTLSWSPDCHATATHVQLSVDSTFASTLLDQTVSAASVTTPTLASSTRYYWRASTISLEGESVFGQKRSFVTGKAPVFPSYSAPYVVRNFSGPVYWNETGTIDLNPSTNGCPCSFSSTFHGGGPYNYATSDYGSHFVVQNLGVSQTVQLGYDVTASNAFGTAPTISVGWSLAPSNRPAGGGCPYVSAWTGDAFEDDNNILPASENSSDPALTYDDYYLLRVKPATREGRYVLRLREFENEVSRLDALELRTVDHPVGTEVAVGPTGQLAVYESIESRTADELGADAHMSGSRTSAAGGPRLVESGTALRLRFGGSREESGHGEQALILRGVAPMKPIHTGKVHNGNSSIGGFTFRERSSKDVVRLGGHKDDLELRFEHSASLEAVSLARLLPLDLTAGRLELRSAVHASLGDVGSDLLGTDGSVVGLAPGEFIELSYEATPVPEGMERSFLLYANGRYDRIDPSAGAEIGSASIGRTSMWASRSGGSGLAFDVNFDLPSEMSVALEVFDVLGRRVQEVELGRRSKGVHSVNWNAGARAAGIYFLKLRRLGVSSPELAHTKVVVAR